MVPVRRTPATGNRQCPLGPTSPACSPLPPKGCYLPCNCILGTPSMPHGENYHTHHAFGRATGFTEQPGWQGPWEATSSLNKISPCETSCRFWRKRPGVHRTEMEEFQRVWLLQLSQVYALGPSSKCPGLSRESWQQRPIGKCVCTCVYRSDRQDHGCVYVCMWCMHLCTKG